MIPVVDDTIDCLISGPGIPIQFGTIVSLWDIMARFDAWGLAMLLHHMDDLRQLATQICKMESVRDEKVPAEIKSSVLSILLQSQHHAQEANLRSTYDRVWDGGPFNRAYKIGLTYQQLQNELTVLRECVEADLEKHMFLFVPTKKAELINEIDKTWGDIWKALPDSKYDTTQGIGCFAMGLDTATVFHFMRVAEHGLRYLARKLRIALTHRGKPHPIEYADWEKVIQAIKNKIDAVRKLPMGSARQEKLTRLSDAADHCTFMKDIWRNTVSHARKPYKSSEALTAMDRVRDFMGFVAGI